MEFYYLKTLKNQSIKNILVGHWNLLKLVDHILSHDSLISYIIKLLRFDVCFILRIKMGTESWLPKSGGNCYSSPVWTQHSEFFIWVYGVLHESVKGTSEQILWDYGQRFWWSIDAWGVHGRGDSNRETVQADGQEWRWICDKKGDTLYHPRISS